MLFGQIGFQCPLDGPQTAGFECIEDMVVHRRGHADITLRCPKCGTLIDITTHTPIIPQPIVEALSSDLGIPFENGKITITALFDSLSATAHSLEFSFEAEDDECFSCGERLLEERALTDAEEAHVGFFANELAHLGSVADFLARADEDSAHSLEGS